MFLVRDQGHNSITEEWFRCEIARFLENDDVFRTEFLQGVILIGENLHEIAVSNEASQFLKSLGTQWVRSFSSTDSNGNLARVGPHALFNGFVREVWRLYSDTNGTLLTALRPNAIR